MLTFTSFRNRSCRPGGWLALLILLLTSPAAFAQLSGAYTINSALPTAGSNYASFTAAAAALTAGGVSGPVTFTVSGGPYTEQLVLTQFTGSSATNRVTFNGGGATIQFGSSNANLPAVVVLNGADYVTINNLTIDAMVGGTSTSTYGWGVQLFNNADNSTISNCNIITSSTSNSSNYQGIVSSASATGASSGTLTNQNLTLSGNTVTGGYYSISVAGSGSATALTPGIVLLNNNVRDFYFYGIFLSYLTAPQVIGNDISRPLRTSAAFFYGLQLSTGISGATVERNRIHHPFGGAPGSANGAYCIYTVSGTTATTTAPNDIVNNLIYEIRTSGPVYGVYNTGSSNIRCYNNTFALDDPTSSGTNPAYGLYQSSGIGVEFKNNIVSINRAGSGTNYAIYIPSSTGSTPSNYNDLTGGNNFVTGYYNGTSYPTLANWRSGSGGLDQNSVAATPQYVGLPTGDLRPSAAALDGAATPLTRVPTDFTGATRNATTPDIGAYEFTPAANDLALQSIDSPVAPVTAGARTVAVTVRNNGTAPLTSVRLEFVLNGGTAVAQTFPLSTVMATGGTAALTFTTPGTLVAGANTLTVTGSLPNGQVDPNPGNNSLTATVNTALSGTYTINKLLPTAGTNFASFTEAGRALTAAGISASVRFNVLNGPYTEQFAVGVVPGVSATDTVVVDGGTSKQTITNSTNSGLPAIVQLNGSDYLTIQNLTIDATGTSFGIGVHLIGQANNNRVANCVITGPALITNTTANAGIAASGSNTVTASPGDASGLRIENNLISGGYYGVVVTGASLTSRASGLRITGNEIRDFYNYGISAESTAGARIISNNIHRSTRTAVGPFYGLSLVGNVGLAVERNRIHDSFTGNALTTVFAYGIYCLNNDGLAGQENDFVNNLIYNFNGIGTEYLAYNSSSDYNRFYHNTFVSDNQSVTNANATYGFYQTTQATGIDLQNNVFYLSRSGSGSRIALNFNTPASTITSNYNDLYLGTGTNYLTGASSTTTYATLTDWRAAAGGAYDQASVAADPVFAAGTWVPTAVQLNNSGLTLARVPRDFANVLRTSPPDLGAYEFSPTSDDVALVSIDSPATPASPTTNPVTVTIRNAGTTVLSTLTLSYVLNGGTPVTQVFTLTPALASNATRQLTFTTGAVPLYGANTLAVTGSLPNGQPDPTAANNTLSTTFTQPLPLNDEPCGAVALGAALLTASNSGATTTVQPGIITPACSSASLPKDVWFTLVPSGTSTTLTIMGAPAGMVRLFTAASCSAGPFVQVFCASSGASNTAFTAPVVVTGLVAGQRYYVAVSGYGSNDTGGQFTIAASAVLATRTANNAALAVFPNPSATGQLTLRLAASGTGSVEIINSLGQLMRRQLLANAAEQSVSTLGLAAGLYTLRVWVGGEIITRKVVLQ